MKRNLLLWVSVLGITLLALACTPAAAPTKSALGDQPKAAAPAPVGSAPQPAQRQDAEPAAVLPFSPSGLLSAPRAPAAAKPAAASGGTAGELSGLDRMIVYAAQTSIEVKDVTDSLEAIADIALRQGGFVVNSNFRYEGERKVATITIKVPARVYQSTLAELRRLAIKVEDESSKSQDVTEEFSDLEAQLRNLEATEARYLDLLKRAGTIDEILKVQARIDDIRRQIDRIKGRMDYLDKTSEMASITISLFSRDKGKVSPKQEPVGWWKTPGEAWEQSLLFLGSIVSAIVIGVAFFWWAIILVAVAGLFAWRSIGRAVGRARR